MTHIDLFAGIGGNSLAFDKVFHEQKNTHIFCEIDKYPRAVLRKHWPDATILTDVRTFTADADVLGRFHGRPQKFPTKGSYEAQREPLASPQPPFILTGGFPCQPFSQAGRRKGTEDDRYLWPAMLGVIRDWKPTWVIAENVRGLVTWNDGMVLETVCSDLEALEYEVQPIIIPAVAVGAPHRRDRIWFVAHTKHDGSGREKREGDGSQDSLPKEHRAKDRTAGKPIGATGDRTTSRHDTNPAGARWAGRSHKDKGRLGQLDRHGIDQGRNWEKDWQEVATSLCGMDDGLLARMDGLELSKSAHRKARLKALGNAIVPAVAVEIMRAIKLAGHL